MRIKKTISLGLTLALALSLIAPALAAPTPQATSTVVCVTNGRSPFSYVPSGASTVSSPPMRTGS